MDPPFNPQILSQMGEAINYQLLIPRHPQHVLPTLFYNSADGAALSLPITNINQYVNQSIAEFITSVKDINNDTAWNAYLRDLDNIGLQQWLSRAQSTYDRQR